MQIGVAFLRGINVSGQKLIKMEALRALCEEIGLKEVRTYIQSGNVVFKAKSLKELESKLSAAIKASFGFEVSVIVKSQESLTKIVGANPFIAMPGRDPAKCYVTIFSSVPDFSRLTENIPESGKDEFTVVEGSVYLYFPERFGDTKYSNAFFEKRLASAATTRNWKTMTTLLGMCDEYNDKPSKKS
ncbi:MAG: DUF1697 domain-containing protein [Chitinophagaceae bacterium]